MAKNKNERKIPSTLSDVDLLGTETIALTLWRCATIIYVAICKTEILLDRYSSLILVAVFGSLETKTQAPSNSGAQHVCSLIMKAQLDTQLPFELSDRYTSIYFRGSPSYYWEFTILFRILEGRKRRQYGSLGLEVPKLCHYDGKKILPRENCQSGKQSLIYPL